MQNIEDIPVLSSPSFPTALEKRSMPGRLANLGCGWINREKKFLNSELLTDMSCQQLPLMYLAFSNKLILQNLGQAKRTALVILGPSMGTSQA